MFRPPDDRKLVVRGEHLVVHPAVEEREIPHELEHARDAAQLARGERIEHPHLDVRVGVQCRRHQVAAAGVDLLHHPPHLVSPVQRLGRHQSQSIFELGRHRPHAGRQLQQDPVHDAARGMVVEQKTDPDAPVCRIEQLAQKIGTRLVAIPDVILHVERLPGEAGQRHPRGECLAPVLDPGNLREPGGTPALTPPAIGERRVRHRHHRLAGRRLAESWQPLTSGHQHKA